MILARRRSTQQDSLLWILAIAAERNMPLAPTRRGVRRPVPGQVPPPDHEPRGPARLRQLGSRGASSGCPGWSRETPCCWPTSGSRPAGCPRRCAWPPQSRSQQLPIWTAIASRFAYLLALLLAMQSICGFLLYFIVPKFEAIFKDFGVALPPVTIGLIEGSHFIMSYGLLTAWVPPLEILLLIFLPFSFAGWVNYDVPFFDRLLKRRHLALILRCALAGRSRRASRSRRA